MTLVGANANAKVTGLDPLPGKSNYFIGNDPKKWRTNVSNYAKVHYADVYPGVDLVYYGNQGQLEYDFVVAPGADPNAIALEIETGNSKLEIGNSKIETGEASSASPESRVPSPGGVRIDANGDLVISTAAGEARFRKPLVYQPSPESRAPDPGSLNPKSKIANPKSLDGGYVILADNRIGFEVPNYDKSLPLIIDPVLSYSARFSLGGSTVPASMAVDSSGSVYLAGVTSSTQFPSTSGAFQTACTPDMQQPDSCQDAFVVKLNAEGSALVYATFLGGSSAERGRGIAADTSGHAYVAGETSSMDFPTTPGAFQTSCAAPADAPTSCADAFVTKLSPDGSSLVYSTFLGGTGTDSAAGVALGSSGDVYVAGSTTSSDFPTANALQPTLGGQRNAFVAKLNATGTALLYSTYLGGSYYHGADAVAVDPQGNAYVTGIAGAHTYCVFPTCYDYSDPYCYTCLPAGFPVDFPTTPGAWQPSCSGIYPAGSCGFLAKISTDGSQLVYSTFLGNTHAHALAVDSAGNAYLAIGGAVDKLNPAGSALVYEADLANVHSSSVNSIAVDTTGNAYVAGTTQSREFLAVVNPIQPSLRGQGDCPGDYRACPDAFVAKFSPDGSAPMFSTYFGGEGSDYGTAMAIDGSGNIYLAGTTDSYAFPTTSGTLTSLPPANVFVAKIAPEDAPGVAVTPVALRLPPEIDPASPYPPAVTVRNVGTAPLTITDTAATAGFVADTLDCLATLATDAACTITVGYDSQAPLGPLSGTLTIADNAADSPQVVPLSGDRTPGTYPTLSAWTLDFGQQVVNSTSPAQTLTLTAAQQEGMAIYAITASGDFTATHDCPLAPSTLAAGGSCTISVTFEPTWRASRIEALAITYAKSYVPLAATLKGTGVKPEVTLSAPILAFAGQSVGSTSPAKPETLTNSGDGPLGTGSIHISYGSFAQSNDCPASLAPAASCVINVTFTPTWSSPQFGFLDIHTSSGDYLVNLYGTTNPRPIVELTPSTVRFADQVVGTTSAPHAVTLTNTGNATLIGIRVTGRGDFALAHNCPSSVAPAESCTISVTFTPTRVGDRWDHLNIYDSTPVDSIGQKSADLRGTGLAPLVSFTPSTLSFGNQVVGTSSPPHIVTLSNTGNAPLNISTIAASGDFASSNACPSSLPRAGSCNISVTFAPTTPGAQTGTLTITDNAPGSQPTVSLIGVGTQPVAALSANTLSFAGQSVGTTSAAQTITLGNTGDAPLSISSLVASGDFAETSPCGPSPSIEPGWACEIRITFTPTAPGLASGAITITDNAPGSPHVVNLSGTGIGPVASLSSNTLSFAGQIVGTTSPVEAVTLTNSGNAPLSIGSITATGDYALTHNCVSPLAAEASCTLSVTFTPTDAGGRAGTLIITDDAAGSPHTVALSGAGQDFSLGTFTTARAVSPGMTARFNLLLMPQGGFQQTVSLACSGAPAGATCSVRPSSVTPNGVNNVSVALEVVTTAPAASAPRDGGWRMSLPPGGWPVATTLALLGVLALLAGIAAVAAVSHRRLAPGTVSPVRTPALQWAPLAVVVILVLLWAACGGGGGLYVRSGGTPAGTYALTITATTSDLSHNTTVKLTVR